MGPIRVKGAVKGRRGPLEFHYLGPHFPYLRIACPEETGAQEYVGALEGWASIRKLRDYLTRALREQP